MKENIIKLIVIIICLLSFVYNYGQGKDRTIELFFSNFLNFEFPVDPVNFILEREGNLQSRFISKKEYDKYLREKNDKFWVFNDYYGYNYGGKKKINNYRLIFYSRHFMPEDINLQKGEFMLVTLTENGEMISSIPVAGGYGDTLTFTSELKNLNHIVVNYIQYSQNGEKKYSKYFFIEKNGEIKQIAKKE